MLSLALVSTRQGPNYYTQDNYYTQNKTIENSEWQGRGAEQLGLQGCVAARDFQALLEGHSPSSKERLYGRGDGPVDERRAGLDLTFSAPKSVSLAALVGQDTALEIAHRESVEVALSVAEERYSLTRTGDKKNRAIERTGNFIAAKFHHDTSRAKDPQLHTHCVVINAVQRADGQWRSLHNEAIFSQSKFLGLIYQNELAKRVRQLGYTIERSDKGTFEIAGYNQEVLEKFSKRRAQLEEMGIENQKDARLAVKKNRPTKGAEIPRSELVKMWTHEAREVGLVHPNPRHELGLSSIPDVGFEREVAQMALKHASEKDVSFKREIVESFALESNLGDLGWEKFQAALRLSEVRGEAIQNKVKLWTTRESILLEEKILSALRSGENRFTPVIKDAEKLVALKHPELGKGQAEAVKLTLESRSQFIAWQGVAGAGKTYAMNVIREFASEAQLPVRGFAPSAEAAKVLEQESGIASQTVASCLAESKRRMDSGKGEIWIVDEAGLLSARDCARLMERAKHSDVRVAFVGDTRQLSAVEAGNPFRLLQAHGIDTAHLTESRRQKSDVLKSSVDLMSQGASNEAIEAISGQVLELRREETRTRYIAREFAKLDHDSRAKTLILAGTNRERMAITEQVRTLLKQEKSLGQSTQVFRLKAKDLSREEMAVAAKFCVGDVLAFHKESLRYGIKKNEIFEVVKVRDIEQQLTLRSANGSTVQLPLLEQQRKFLVYERAPLEIAVGERLKWTKNNRNIDVRNGEECVAIAINESKLRLQKRDGRIVEHSVNEPLYIDHNYVHTVFASQGKTCDRVFISVDKTFGQEAMYVALSRARYEAKIITPDKDEMLAMISQSRAKVSALEVVSERELGREYLTEISHKNKSQKQS